jgi:pimeloyl-ACP methyl ester carboxylesterase
MADIEAGLRLHYVTAGDGSRTIVLLHGFPQTWWEWHAVIDPLVADGFRVVGADDRGAGQSWRPVGGYDKRTMAFDIQRLLREHLGVDGPVVIAGHDIGMMIAAAFAMSYRDEVSHLVVIDAPLPGTAVFDRLRTDPRVWHFAFHGARERVARDTFDRLGALGWAEQARQELRAAGESSTRRAPEAWDQLSPQEMQIAQMLALGLSNKEIGQRLYLSHRTVASHLYRVFPKIGVTSRAQLTRAVTARPTAGTSSTNVTSLDVV